MRNVTKNPGRGKAAKFNYQSLKNRADIHLKEFSKGIDEFYDIGGFENPSRVIKDLLMEWIESKPAEELNKSEIQHRLDMVFETVLFLGKLREDNERMKNYSLNFYITNEN